MAHNHTDQPLSQVPFNGMTCSQYAYNPYGTVANFDYPVPPDIHPYNPYGTVANFYFPERECVVADDPSLVADFYTGLSVDGYLEDPVSCNAYQGIAVTCQLDLPLSPPALGHGSTLEASLSVPKLLSSEIHSGSTLETFTLSDSLSCVLGMGMEAVVGELITPLELAPAYYGIELIPFEIANLSDAYYGMDTFMVLDLAWSNLNQYYAATYLEDVILVTDEIMPPALEHGLSIEAIEMTEPYLIEMGTCISHAYLGYPNYFNIYPNTIEAYNLFTSCSFNRSYETFFDIPPYCCQDYVELGSDNLRIDTTHDFNVNEEASWNKGYNLQDTDLSTMVNMSAKTYYGMEMWLWMGDEFSNMSNLSMGYGMEAQMIIDWERRINLCPPAILIYGENVSIDMVDLDHYRCTHDAAYYGMTLEESKLSVGWGWYCKGYYGMEAVAELTTDSPWGGWAWYGTGAEAGFPWEPKASIEYGMEVEGKFYEPTWDAYTGLYIHAPLVTYYWVEFLDWGCLDNEYIYVDEQGERQDHLTLPQAIEFLPYRHWIKARCF